MMDIIKSCVKNINYPLASVLSGRCSRLIFYNNCIKKQYQLYDDIIRERNDKLYDIVMYAISHVPYYRDVVDGNKLTFSRESITDDIQKLPVLTKEIIRNEGSRLYSTEHVKYCLSTSGGSTGEPVQLHRDIHLNKLGIGNYFLSYAGHEIGDKLALLWGSEKDILEGSVGVKEKIINKYVMRRRLLNSFMMSREDMFDYVRIINQWKPKTILAYTQSIYELARFIREENLVVNSPRGIVVSAGTLFKDWKDEIEAVFRCPVINQYGSRETPGIAISCTESDELHINTFVNYLEIVDDHGNILPNEVDGNILVTSLINKSMPLIRYMIGDVGALSSRTVCKCGRNLPCLTHVTGRTVNIFKRRDGTKIDGEYFTHLFYGIEEVKRFQVIQTDYEHVQIKIISKSPLAREKEETIFKNIKAVMGDDCHIDLEYTDEILPTNSGKNLYTISLI